MTTEELLSQESTAVLDEDRWVDPDLARLARRAATEGMVLLHNEDVLPLAEGQSVAVFGRGQVDWMAAGYGSGGDVNAAYITTLLESLEQAQVPVNTEVADAYRAWCADHPIDHGTWGNWPHSYPEMPLPEGLVEQAAATSDVAVVVVGRAAGEDRDNTLTPGSWFLTDEEHAMLEAVTAGFDRTVVVVNTGNMLDFAWVEQYRPTAVLLAWLGGMEGGRAVADVLTGVSEPGGRLTATIARRYEDHPTAANFGHDEFDNYAEDVFVGYRWFETFAPETVMFPFGYGLGYTDFAIAVEDVAGDEEMVHVSLTVTNTGNRPGRHVVQVYASPADGHLSKPTRVLVAYGKCDVLQPGESQQVRVGFPVLALGSYDDSGATGHRHAWVLEPGDYDVLVGSNVRQAELVGTYRQSDLRVLRQLEEVAAVEPEHAFDRVVLNRRDDGTAEPAWEPVPTRTVDLADRILSRLPEAIGPAVAAGASFADVAAGRATLDEFIAQLDPHDLVPLCFGDLVMNSPLGAPGNAGALGGVSEALRRRGVPPVITTDGPSGLRLSTHAALLPCGVALASTWDPPLVEQLAKLHAQEMVRKGSDVLLSPGMNIHRDPLCGRNFEYFSEDPLISGKSASAVVQGVQSQGVSACPKHFAANNQEHRRTTHDSRVSQRALREIYLRGFEICVRESAPKNIMTSYNKINGVWGHYHYDLVTTVLRDEWGYRGNVVTDWWMQPSPDPHFPALRDSAYRIRAQVDVLMPGEAKPTGSGQFDDAIQEGLQAPDGLTLGELQRTARNVLQQVLDNRAAMDREFPIEAPPRRPRGRL